LVAAVSGLEKFAAKCGRRFAFFFLFLFCLMTGMGVNFARAQATNQPPHFNVTGYVVSDNALLPSNNWDAVLSKYTGANVSLDDIVKAATQLQGAYRDRGCTNASIAVSPDQIANGIVTLNVFQTVIPQVVVSGVRYIYSTNGVVAASLPLITPVLVPPTPPEATPAPEVMPAVPALPAKPASPGDIAKARASLIQQMLQADSEKEDNRIHVVSTNAGPRFPVERYRIMGNTVLSPQEIAMVLTNIDGDYGTNVSIDGIRTAIEQLQEAYRDRGYMTVAVGLPQQRLTNAVVKVQVTEGRLAIIDVEGNHYFSSNNVMRALPSLHTNMLLNGKVLQGELIRANANQDRQIYPVIGPGPDPGTSALTLHVKDQLPLHAKIDLDNFSSPATPDLRVNASGVYNNLWQLEHSVGVQYSFSPELYKTETHWNFYDLPQVANYSVFYRLPLGSPASLQNEINANPGSFGYSEATRKFNLPPAGGLPELTIFASRSTIDTGTSTTLNETLTTNNPVISRSDYEHSPTINEDVAAHLDYPLSTSGNLQSLFSGGLDFKFFQVINYKTNVFTYVQTNIEGGVPTPVTTVQPSNIPLTEDQVEYLPLSLRYTGNWNDPLGVSTIGLGFSANLWENSRYATTAYDTNGNALPTVTIHGKKGFGFIAGSTLASGHWIVVNPSFSRTLVIDGWTTLFRADGQWASEPLLSPEQFGAGGVNSVRGYPEGDAFGDDGWHVSLEQQTPLHTVGMISGGTPLTIAASIYLDYATVYLIDPSETPEQRLCGTGFGFTAAAGSHWQARFLFSFPLISTADTPAYEPRFNFSLTAQF
jgi:hemolysin activation/secretion protein